MVLFTACVGLMSVHSVRVDSQSQAEGEPGIPDSAPCYGRWGGSRFPAVALVIILLGFITWIALPKLPEGICFDDPGDLQLVSATLGIAHPPGYPGYATVGFLLTRIPWVDPAYVISVACMATGLVALAVCMLLQRHFGVNIWFASALTLALAAHPRFWTNLRAPEVYMPTLALVVSSAYLLLRYAKCGRRWNLVLAVFLFGFALGNRPPVLFAAPFFLIAWNMARKKWGTGPSRGWYDLAWMVPLAAAPTFYSFGYIYVRDQPDTCYNYIDNHNEELNVLPESSDGVRAKIRRTVWHLSGEQFREYMGTNWRGLVGKLRWLRTQVAFESPFTDILVFVMLTIGLEPPPSAWYPQIDVYALATLALIGLILGFRRCRISSWLLTGLAVSCVVFVLAYKVFGQAADLLPLLFAETVALGILGSRLFPAGGGWVRQTTAFCVAVGAGVLFAFHVPARDPNSTGVAASNFLSEIDLATFPGPAVICSDWRESVPLRYAQCVLTPRPDLHIVTSGPELWRNLAEQETTRPVYAADALNSGGVCELEPFRNVFQLHCPKQSGKE